MIKYPVKAECIKTYGIFVLDANGKSIAECQNMNHVYLIANSINALNEFPKPLHEEPDKITFGNRLFDWYDRYINPKPVKEVK